MPVESVSSKDASIPHDLVESVGGVEFSDHEPLSEDASNSHGSGECTGGPEISDNKAPTQKVEIMDATES